MNRFRAILPLVFFAAVFAPAFAWVADESAPTTQSAVLLETENTAQADVDPVALDEQTDPQSARAKARFDEWKKDMRKQFYLLLAAMIAFLGLPRLAWKNGKLDEEE